MVLWHLRLLTNLHDLPRVCCISASRVAGEADAVVSKIAGKFPRISGAADPVAVLASTSSALDTLCSLYYEESPNSRLPPSSLRLPPSLLLVAHHLCLSKLRLLILALKYNKGNLLCLPLHSAMSDCINLACLVDSNHGAGRTDHSNLEKVVQCLQEVFAACLGDRTELAGNDKVSKTGSKKVLVLRTVNLLFKCYFKLNTLRLCKNVSRPVEAKGLDTMTPLGGLGEIYTYKYYIGRVNMFEDNYESAEDSLSAAYTGCPVSAKGNRRRCLNYLIPVRMARGSLPCKELLVSYGLEDTFWDIVEGIRVGNLDRFMSGLHRNRRSFISKGTYLLLEKCKVISYRNLFKRVQIIHGSTQVPLGYVSKAFRRAGADVDEDEVECVLSNLIFKGFVRGYISHEKKTIVVSKKNPFPKDALRR